MSNETEQWLTEVVVRERGAGREGNSVSVVKTKDARTAWLEEIKGGKIKKGGEARVQRHVCAGDYVSTEEAEWEEWKRRRREERLETEILWSEHENNSS